MDIENEGGGSSKVTIEPPPGMGIPTDDAPAPDAAAETKVEPEKPAIKLPASVKPPPSKPSSRFQGRISELVGQRDAASRERDELRAENQRMKGISRPGETKKTAAGPVEGAPPSPDDFETYGEFVAAQVEYTLNKQKEADKSAANSAAYEDHRAERRAAFDVQAQPLADEYGDGFWEVITDPNLPVSEAMASAVLELDEMGPFIMLYLAAHRDEALKMAKMNPRAATVEIGKLAAKLDFEIKNGGDGAAAATEGSNIAGGGQGVVAGQVPPQAVTKAAPKPSPVQIPRGSTAAVEDASPKDTDDVQEWLRKETNRLRRQNPQARFYGAT